MFLWFGAFFLDRLLRLFQLLAQLRKKVLCGIGFLSAFLSGTDIGFFLFVFHILTTIFCAVHSIRAPMILADVAMLLKANFFGTLAIDSVPGLLFSFLLLLEAFLLDCALDFSCAHTRSITSRDIRSECMSSWVIPFLWRLKWSCHVSGHIQRTWLARSALVNGMFMEFYWAWHWGCRTSMVVVGCRSWAVIHAAQTDHADVLGFLKHVCDVVPLLLLSRVVGKHGEKVDHHAVVKWLAQISTRSFLGTALYICVGVGLCLLVDNLVPHVLGIVRQQACVELEHDWGSLFHLGIGFLCGFLGLLDFRQVQYSACKVALGWW